jgi:hypothetical protein
MRSGFRDSPADKVVLGCLGYLDIDEITGLRVQAFHEVIDQDAAIDFGSLALRASLE